LSLTDSGFDRSDDEDERQALAALRQGGGSGMPMQDASTDAVGPDGTANTVSKFNIFCSHAILLKHYIAVP
jgi:hypothetical protein